MLIASGSLGPTQKADAALPPIVAWSLAQLEALSPSAGPGVPGAQFSAPGKSSPVGGSVLAGVALDALSCFLSGGTEIEVVARGAAQFSAPGKSSSSVPSGRWVALVAASLRGAGVPHETTAAVQEGWSSIPVRIVARFSPSDPALG